MICYNAELLQCIEWVQIQGLRATRLGPLRVFFVQQLEKSSHIMYRLILMTTLPHIKMSTKMYYNPIVLYISSFIYIDGLTVQAQSAV